MPKAGLKRSSCFEENLFMFYGKALHVFLALKL
jgi:hypothetical protein